MREHDYLYHYGVLGMHWGVRKQEPSGSGKRAKQKRKGLSDTQKQLIILGASVAAAGLIAYGAYKLHEHVLINDLWDRRFKPGDTLEQKMSKLNPYRKVSIFSGRYKGSHANCGQATIAHELLCRGREVYAKTNEYGTAGENMGNYFTGWHEGSITRLTLDNLLDGGDARKIGPMTSESVLRHRGEQVRDAIMDHIKTNYPVGARGNILAASTTSNHYFSWERKPDSVEIYNPQDTSIDMVPWMGTIVTRGTTLADHYGGMRVTRLDDLGINEANIHEVVTEKIYDKAPAVLDTFSPQVVQGENFVLKDFRLGP